MFNNGAWYPNKSDAEIANIVTNTKNGVIGSWIWTSDGGSLVTMTCFNGDILRKSDDMVQSWLKVRSFKLS